MLNPVEGAIQPKTHLTRHPAHQQQRISNGMPAAGHGASGATSLQSTVYLSLATFSLSWSGSAPTISSSFSPFFMKWKVGMAETPAACATSSFSSTSTLTKTTWGLGLGLGLGVELGLEVGLGVRS